jgi:hypothetical protein
MSEQNIKKWIAIILALNVVMFGGGLVVGQLSTQTVERAPPLVNVYSAGGYLNETTFNMAWNITHTNITALTWYNDSFVVMIGINRGMQIVVNDEDTTTVLIQVDYNCNMVSPDVHFDGIVAYYRNNTTSINIIYNRTLALQGRFVAIDYITIIFFGHGTLKDVQGLACSAALTIGVDWYE